MKSTRAIDKTKVTYFIGVDVSKYWFDYTVLNNTSKVSQGRIDNNDEGFLAFERQLPSNGIRLDWNVLIIIEDSGIYGELLVGFLSYKKSILWVENPLKIKRSIGLTRGKSDKVDSQRIAEYSRRNLDKLIQYSKPRKQIRMLKELIGNRDRLVKAKRLLECLYRK